MATTFPSPAGGQAARVHQLRALIQAQEYVVDPRLVAGALLARTDPRHDPVVLPPIRRGDARTRPAAPPPGRGR